MRKFIAGAALVLWLGVAGHHIWAAEVVPARVDPSAQFGTWQGWGVSLAWWANIVGGFPDAARQDYMEKAFDPVKGLGLNIVRYNIGGGENPAHLAPNSQALWPRAVMPGFLPKSGRYDWDADANQRWVLREAARRGADQVEAFSNSPPWWMTKSGSVQGGVHGAENLDPAYNAAFADYLATVVQHFHDVWGVTFRDVEPLNEPSFGWAFPGRQEGCHVDRPQQVDVLHALDAAMQRRNAQYATLSASDEQSIADAEKTFPYYDAAVLAHLSKINTHSYGGGNRTRLGSWAVTAGKDLWLSEYGDIDATGLRMSRQILTDVRGLHSSAWIYWQMVDATAGWGFLRNPLADETTMAYTINKKFYVMAQYSRFIRPGYTILAVADPNTLAAWDPRTETLVLVTTNDTSAPSSRAYDLAKFTGIGEAAVFRTSPTEDLAALPRRLVLGGTLTDTAPPGSVTTYVMTGAAFQGPRSFDYRDDYQLVSPSTGTVISGKPGAKPPPGAALPKSGAVTLTPSDSDLNQHWGLLATGDGSYTLVNRATGLVLDGEGTAPVQMPDAGTENQHWRFVAAGQDAVTVVNAHSGLALSASDSRLFFQAGNGRPFQTWRLVRVTDRGER